MEETVNDITYYALISPPRNSKGMWTVAVGDTPPSELDKAYPVTYGMRWTYTWTERGAKRRAKRWIKQYRKIKDHGGLRILEFPDDQLEEEYKRIKRELANRKGLTL